MSRFSVIVLCTTLIGAGLAEGRVNAQGTGGARRRIVDPWLYYPLASPWDTAASREAAAAAAQQAAAQQSAATQAAIDQRVNAARDAESQRRAAYFDAAQEAAAQRQAQQNEIIQQYQQRRQLEDSENERITEERETVARGITQRWRQLASAGARALPTDLAGATPVAQHPASGAAVVTHAVLPAVQAARCAEVRANFRAQDLFSAKWFQDHADAWKPARWANPDNAPSPSGAAWRSTTWGHLTAWLGWNVKPFSYNFGINIKVQYGFVYLNGEVQGSEEKYYQQALALAETKPGDPPPQDEWLPLGVFAMVEEGKTRPAGVTHLAIDRSGLIRGNFFNPLTGKVLPVRGALDRKTQRMAGVAGGTDLVFQAGLYNLTQEVTPVLVNLNKDKTEQWLLVRLKPPAVFQPPATAPSVAPPASEGAEPASLEIRVPVDAAIWFDGSKSSQTGSDRTFVTPPLKPGEVYTYHIRARWTKDGAPVEQTRTVTVRAGQRTRVDFLAPGP
jgi:uncharacterized protein (TIGR03000 family)